MDKINTLLWSLQLLLAIVFILPGYGKLRHTKQQHIADGHLSPGQPVWPIRVLGVLEWLGCIGLLLPWGTQVLPILTPITAACFCLLMIAGMIVHARKKEYRMLPMLFLIGLLAAIVACGRMRQLIRP